MGNSEEAVEGWGNTEARPAFAQTRTPGRSPPPCSDRDVVVDPQMPPGLKKNDGHTGDPSGEEGSRVLQESRGLQTGHPWRPVSGRRTSGSQRRPSGDKGIDITPVLQPSRPHSTGHGVTRGTDHYPRETRNRGRTFGAEVPPTVKVPLYASLPAQSGTGPESERPWEGQSRLGPPCADYHPRDPSFETTLDLPRDLGLHSTPTSLTCVWREKRWCTRASRQTHVKD